MKKILIIIVGIVIFQSCSVEPNPEIHFIDEDFVLLDKYYKEKMVNGNTVNLRTWKIQRILGSLDTTYIGIIEQNDGSQSCICSHNIITDELWNEKEVGDILHFDYLRKDRFSKELNIKYDEGSITVTTTEPIELKTVETAIINLNKLEIERRILEIEREIMSLERELEMLKTQK